MQLWGPETDRAIENFRISGEPVPAAVVRWIARIKGAAARVNAELGRLPADRAERIAAAADAIADGGYADQFPVDVFQTGSGTSTHTNVNEVVGRLADAHPNDDVNLGQSSNDVFPSAVHLAVIDTIDRELLPALVRLERSLRERADRFSDVVKAGRTHLMDAVPMTVGQELGGWATQVAQGRRRVEGAIPALSEIPLGGTAVGTGINGHPEFAPRVRGHLARSLGRPVLAPADPFEAQGARDALVEVSGALRSVGISLSKVANDIRLLASGPRTGLGELVLPALQKGSTIMPGKVNPVIPEVVVQVGAQVVGNDAAVVAGALQSQLDLAAVAPLLARNVLQSVHLLAAAATAFAEKAIDGLEVDRDRCERYAGLTLSSAAILALRIGYDRSGELVAAAARTGRALAEVAREAGVAEEVLAELDPRALAGISRDAGGAARPVE